MKILDLAAWALALLLPASTPHAAASSAGGGACSSSGHCHLTPWTPSAPAPGVGMGYSVVMEGDVAATARIGADSVEVFERVDGAWVSTAVLEDPAGTEHLFGFDIDISGNVMAIGAPNDHTVAGYAGAVHVFERIDGSWTFGQTVYPTIAQPSGVFGIEVDIDGTWMAVGQPGGPGRVETYLRIADGSWVSWEVIAAPAPDAKFGWSLAMRAVSDPAGIQLAVGIPDHPLMGTDAGAFSFQTRLLNGSLATTTYYPPGIGDEDRAGFSIDFHGETLVVGSPGDGELGDNLGAAHVYHIEPVAMAPTLTFVDKLMACTDDLTVSRLGSSVDVFDGRVALGHGGVAAGELGAAFVYRPSFLGDWELEERVQAGAPGDQFGADVALGAECVLVGARNLDVAAQGAGGVFYFSLTPDSLEGGLCPCDSLAAAEAYGAGKPGSVGVPELTAISPPVPGELTVVVLKQALVGSAPFLIWGLTEAAIPFDGGTLLVGDPHFHFLPIVGVLGQVGAPWNVFDQPVLCGLDVYLQAMFLDPGASGGLHTAQSNGLKLTVGY